MSAGLQIAVVGDLEAGHVARHAIAASESTPPMSVQDDLALLVTELIQNAVRDPPPVRGDSSGGWGLFLVDRIAQRSGVSPAPAGTCVWFELPVSATH